MSEFLIDDQERKNEYGDDFGVVVHVKIFGEVYHHGQRTVQGEGLFKIEGFIMCDREDEANGVVVGSEIMLDKGQRE